MSCMVFITIWLFSYLFTYCSFVYLCVISLAPINYSRAGKACFCLSYISTWYPLCLTDNNHPQIYVKWICGRFSGCPTEGAPCVLTRATSKSFQFLICTQDKFIHRPEYVRTWLLSGKQYNWLFLLGLHYITIISIHFISFLSIVFFVPHINIFNKIISFTHTKTWANFTTSLSSKGENGILERPHNL